MKIENAGDDFELGWRKKKIESTTPEKLTSPEDRITDIVFGFLGLARLIVRSEVGLVEPEFSVDSILKEIKEDESIPNLLRNLKRYFQERD